MSLNILLYRKNLPNIISNKIKFKWVSKTSRYFNSSNLDEEDVFTNFNFQNLVIHTDLRNETFPIKPRMGSDDFHVIQRRVHNKAYPVGTCSLMGVALSAHNLGT